jgi:hypothetical protein
LIFTFCAASSAAGTPTLPEISGWRCGELRSVQLDSVSGNHGYWQERDYRTPDGISIKATLTYGTGPKFYNQPPNGVVFNGDFPGSGSSYEIISIAGQRALVEKDPLLGYAVAVNAFEKKFTLTVECGRFENRDDVISLAEELTASIMREAE